MELRFSVTQQQIARVDRMHPVSDSREYLHAEFEFLSEDWQAATERVMIVTRAGMEAANVALDGEGVALVPAAYLERPEDGRTFALWLALAGYGADGLVITTAPVGVDVYASNYAEAGPPTELPPDVAAQIFTEMAALREYVADKGITYTPTVSEAGVISWTNDGERENPEPVDIRGPQGAAGYTPVRGKDYWTAEDQAAVDAARAGEEERVAAEDAREAAEQGRAAAEQTRAAAESRRAAAETARAQAEQTRSTAEATRAQAEQTRAAAEQARAEAETQRGADWQTLKSDAEQQTAAAATAVRNANEAAEAANGAADRADAAAGRADEAASGIEDRFAESEKELLDKVCPPIEQSGSVVQCYPVEGYPLDVVTRIEVVQEGEGDPSPDNVRPIVGWDGLTVTRCGENLLDLSGAEIMGMYGFTTQLLADGRVRVSGTYTFEQSSVAFAFADLGMAAANKLRRLAVQLKPIGSEEHVLRIRWANDTSSKLAVDMRGLAQGNTYDMTFGAMAYIGDAPTTYATYTGDTYTQALPETVYGGSYNWATGELVVKYRGYSITGTESMFVFSNYFYVTMQAIEKVLDFSSGRCSHYKYATYTPEGIGFALDGGTIIYEPTLYELNDDGLAQWRAYLKGQYDNGTPVTVIGQLAKPITYHLTPQQILAIPGVNTVFSNSGDTTVTGRADPVRITQSMLDRLAALEAADSAIEAAVDAAAETADAAASAIEDMGIVMIDGKLCVKVERS